MRRFAFFLSVFALTLSIHVSAPAQTPEAAVNNFKNALKKAGNGDLDGAIEDYTRAITLSSRVETTKTSSRSGNSFSSGTEVSSDSNIVIVDPFIANAYSNRGLARYEKGDLEGALEDGVWAAGWSHERMFPRRKSTRL